MQTATTPDGIRNVMVWRPDRLGDAVTTVPAMKLLRAHLPRAHVTYVTTDYAREFVEIMGMADTIHALGPKGRVARFRTYWDLSRQVRLGEFDRIFVLTKTSRYARRIGPLEDTYSVTESLAKHAAADSAETVARGLEIPIEQIPSTALALPDRPEISDRIREFGLDLSGEPYLVIHPGSNRMMRRSGAGKDKRPDKRWPLKKHRQLVAQLVDGRPRLKVVLVGTANERPHIAAAIAEPLGAPDRLLNLAGKTSVRDVLQLLKHARVLVSADSGIMHLGTVVRTPLVVLFGPTLEGMTGPFGMGDRVTFVRAVPYELAVEQWDCMDRISVERVFDAVDERLESGAAPERP